MKNKSHRAQRFLGLNCCLSAGCHLESERKEKNVGEESCRVKSSPYLDNGLELHCSKSLTYSSGMDVTKCPRNVSCSLVSYISCITEEFQISRNSCNWFLLAHA